MSRWQDGKIDSSAADPGDSLTIPQTTGDHIELGREVYIDGSGVFGERITIDDTCGIAREPLVQLAMAAVFRLEQNRSLIAFGAGQVLVDLLTGEIRSLLQAGSIEDVTADQSWWLVQEGDALSLRSAGSLVQR